MTATWDDLSDDELRQRLMNRGLSESLALAAVEHVRDGRCDEHDCEVRNLLDKELG